jgi:thymidylate synthase
MYAETYTGINSFLIGASRLLISEGVKRETRGYVCFELPEPAMFKITNPRAREITIPERKWFKTLPYAESLWIASGRNDMAYIVHYLPRMMEFSDDGVYMRGGYGPRYRDYNGEIEDYRIETINVRQPGSVDQLRYVTECFKADKETRRAVMSFGDPMKDDFDENGVLKISKDIPCTRELHFMKQSGSDKLDLIVRMRSNDLIWGASGVNIFNYTFMLEYVAAILGMKVGNYYHIADNLHYYERHSEQVRQLAEIGEWEDETIDYDKCFRSLEEFDELISRLSNEEAAMRDNMGDYSRIEFEDPFFEHWYEVLYRFNDKRRDN